jgi:hypothetical protein
MSQEKVERVARVFSEGVTPDQALEAAGLTD